MGNKKYIVKCPICGKEICRCFGNSDIQIKCKECNTNFTIIKDEESITLRESAAGYMAK